MAIRWKRQFEVDVRYLYRKIKLLFLQSGWLGIFFSIPQNFRKTGLTAELRMDGEETQGKQAPREDGKDRAGGFFPLSTEGPNVPWHGEEN